MWKPQIVAALALSAKHFVVAYGELDYDDPFTAVLEYDGAFSQPWSRIDIKREIKAITNVSPAELGRYAVASDEGDVYFIGETTVREKIVGAGFASPDATGLGGILTLQQVGTELLAAGQGDQVYRRVAAEQWDRLTIAVLPNAKTKPISFTAVVGLTNRDVYAVGFAAPAQMTLDEDHEQKLIEKGDWGEIFAAHDLTTDSALKVDQGRVLHGDGEEWRQLDLPGAAVVKDAFIETHDKVWLVGTGGTILLGNAKTGFRRIDVNGFSGTFLSMTKLDETYILAADYSLYTFDGRQLAPLRPRLRKAPPNPFKVQAIEGTMFYFDYKQGVHRYDGNTWTALPIPPDLLQRKFDGLPRPATP